MFEAAHLDLDGAWPADVLGIPRIDATQWGPKLRYVARSEEIEEFWAEVKDRLPPVVVYGSGDFHHLAGVFIRRVAAKPFTLISFDNHPDWDVRPPYWSCGGWAARALLSGMVERVSVWGCGNFELRFPGRMFADRAAIKSGKLEIHAWSERQPPSVCRRFDCMTRENWRERFEQFIGRLAGASVYVTVDMDCLRSEEAVTNWENGLFTADDVAWAIGRLRVRTNVVGTDICGAYSAPAYARARQRFAGWWDHPKIVVLDKNAAREINIASLRKIAGVCLGLADSNEGFTT